MTDDVKRYWPQEIAEQFGSTQFVIADDHDATVTALQEQVREQCANDYATLIGKQEATIKALQQRVAELESSACDVCGRLRFKDDPSCSGCMADEVIADLTAKLAAAEGDYQRIIAEVLKCNPLPASSRTDDQLEPPWEVIARLRTNYDRLRALVEALKVNLNEALSGYRYDPSWIRPLQLSMKERQDLYNSCIAEIDAALLTARGKL